ncbi:MAG: LutC/YkgG family protein [Thermoguttaceae bacterium]
MSSRDAILSRIRTCLSHEPERPLPPIPPVWPVENPSAEKMAQRFVTEIEAVAGEVHRFPTMEAAAEKLAEIVEDLNAEFIGRTDHPLCNDLIADLPPECFVGDRPDATATELARLAASLVGADTLLADTGTVMVACATTHHRLMCYLPPVCIVIAHTSQLAEHMPAAWEKIAPRVADPTLRGEFVFITGPSRTADIEKILILGVHGPKRLVVLLVG